MRWGSLGIAALMMAGCVPHEPPQTASGHPEHTLVDVSLVCVRGQLMSYVVNSGFAIKQSSDTQIVAGRISQDFGANVFLGTRFGGAPEERIMLTMIPLSETSMRVLLYGGYVSNPGTGFESVTPVAGSASDSSNLSARLNEIAGMCPAKKPEPVKVSAPTKGRQAANAKDEWEQAIQGYWERRRAWQAGGQQGPEPQPPDPKAYGR